MSSGNFTSWSLSLPISSFRKEKHSRIRWQPDHDLKSPHQHRAANTVFQSFRVIVPWGERQHHYAILERPRFRRRPQVMQSIIALKNHSMPVRKYY